MGTPTWFRRYVKMWYIMQEKKVVLVRITFLCKILHFFLHIHFPVDFFRTLFGQFFFIFTYHPFH